MKTKHTPGPWRAHLARTVYHIYGRNDATPVCTVSITPPRIPEPELREKAVSEAHGNAHLIASVPELVAALERFVGYADQHSHTEVLDEIATQARAALEKAGRGVEGGGEARCLACGWTGEMPNGDALHSQPCPGCGELGNFTRRGA